MARSGKPPATQSSLRIIGGQWRGRKLSFLPAEGLRPTTDRVRETLFNWLAPAIHGARCLDLFAGSGALGLEALSRGAAACDFVDSSPGAIKHIRQHLQMLGAGASARCHLVAAQTFLQQVDGEYDIVFIDPPFGRGLVQPVCDALANAGALRDGALVYIEAAAREPLPTLPVGWRAHRDKVAGEVAYRLFRVEGGTVPAGQ
jgi:16S rRNA (guanine966-N2)-methyltransferase